MHSFQWNVYFVSVFIAGNKKKLYVTLRDYRAVTPSITCQPPSIAYHHASISHHRPLPPISPSSQTMAFSGNGGNCEAVIDAMVQINRNGHRRQINETIKTYVDK